MRPRSPISVTCQNRRCDYFGKEHGKDIIKQGKNHAGHQQYLCLHCEKIFLETTNKFRYYKHLPEAEINHIIKLLVEKKGIRSISRSTEHHRDTISHLLEDMALNYDEINKHIFFTFQLTRSDIVNFWITVKKNKKLISDIALKNIESVLKGLNSKELKLHDSTNQFFKKNHNKTRRFAPRDHEKN
jgi:transposase-like protein